MLVNIFLHVKHEQVFINSISTMDLNKIAKPNRWHRTDGWTDWQTPIYSQLYFGGIKCLNSKSALLFDNAYKWYLDLKLALPITFCYRTFSVWGSDRAYRGSSRNTPINPFPMPVWRGLLPRGERYQEPLRQWGGGVTEHHAGGTQVQTLQWCLVRFWFLCF